MNQERLQRWSYMATTRSPLHIGTGEEMTPLEYHIGNDLIVPDLDKIFSKYPVEVERFSQNLARVSSSDLARTRLSSLLDRKILEDQHVWRYSMPAIRNSATRFDSLNRLKNEIAREHGKIKLAIKSPDYRAYIPGTSLKGAFKTAWAYNQCLKTPRLLETVLAKLKEHGSRIEKNAEQVLMASVFQAPAQPKDAAYDIFRVLQIGDSQPRKADDVMILIAERVLSAGIYASDPPAPAATASASYKTYWVFCEAIDENLVFSGSLAVDQGLLNDSSARRLMGWNDAQLGLSVTNLCQAANKFAADLCEFEIEYFDSLQPDERNYDAEAVINFYLDLRESIADVPANMCFLPLGHGSGWHKLTIGLLIEKKLSLVEFAEMRRATNLARQHTQFIFPKSRKLVMDGERSACSPLGWLKLEFTPEQSR